MLFTFMQEKSAGLVIFNDGKYLLLHYEAGHWDFPKGHIEKGESSVSAALRELEEETGIIDADILSGFEHKIKYFFKRAGQTVAKEVVFFVARSSTSKVVLSDEHIGFEWLPFSEAIAKLTYDNAKEVLREADAFLKNVKES